jgi:hypothetical protein
MAALPANPTPTISPAEMQILVSRAGLVLNPGQVADLVLAWRQVAGLIAGLPHDRPLADDMAYSFRLPPPVAAAPASIAAPASGQAAARPRPGPAKAAPAKPRHATAKSRVPPAKAKARPSTAKSRPAPTKARTAAAKAKTARAKTALRATRKPTAPKRALRRR